MSRPCVKRLRLCDVHRSKKYYPKLECPACTRASINFHNMTILHKLFPKIMKDEANA